MPGVLKIRGASNSQETQGADTDLSTAGAKTTVLNSALTVTKAGKYLVAASGSIYFTNVGAPTENVSIFIEKDGVSFPKGEVSVGMDASGSADDSSRHGWSRSFLINLASGEVLTLSGQASSHNGTIAMHDNSLVITEL